MVLHQPDFEKIKNQVIHIGSGKETSVLEVAKIILHCFNLPETYLKFVPDRPGQVCCHISSTRKAKELLNWESTISLKEGIQQTILWYSNHKDWWEKREIMQHVPISIDGETVELH